MRRIFSYVHFKIDFSSILQMLLVLGPMGYVHISMTSLVLPFCHCIRRVSIRGYPYSRRTTNKLTIYLHITWKWLMERGDRQDRNSHMNCLGKESERDLGNKWAERKNHNRPRQVLGKKRQEKFHVYK